MNEKQNFVTSQVLLMVSYTDSMHSAQGYHLWNSSVLEGGVGRRRHESFRIRSISEPRLAGRVFGPSKDRWDATCLFHPIVVQDPLSSHWRMYYYGRDSTSWHNNVSPALMSTGRIGVASSVDGAIWSPSHGPLPKGAILDPRSNSTLSFDCVHVGCSDVHFYQGMWWMYYFGGGLDDSVKLPGGKSLTGMKLRVGLCKSLDGIHGFDEIRSKDPVLDVGEDNEWDSTMVAWARVIPPSTKHPTSHWLMTYSSMDMSTSSSSPSFAIGLAISQDGVKWTKMGKILERGETGCWDDGGVSRRHVIFSTGQYLMFYEGVNKKGVHAIGLATSRDGITWVKDTHGSHSQPGGPIFAPYSQEQDGWDSGGISCPHVVNVGDSLRLYYVGFDVTKKVSAFGLAISDQNNIRRFYRV